MDDEKVRELIGQYRPVGPPSHLRARAVGGAVSSPRVWPWAAAAAALLAVTVTSRIASERVVVLEQPLDATAASVDALAEALGGGAEARQIAELAVTDDELQRVLSNQESAMEMDLNGFR